MNITDSRVPAGSPAPDVTVEVTELQVVPGETARFPFGVRGVQVNPSMQNFDATPDNPNFHPAWAHIIRSTDTRPSHYALEIHPTGNRRAQYGAYPLRLYRGSPGPRRHAEGRCTPIITPCVR